MKAETIVAQPSVCPECNSEIVTTGKNVHYCVSPQEQAAGLRGDYVALFDGKLIALCSTPKQADEALNDYVFDLLDSGLLEGSIFQYLAPVIIPEAAFQAAAIRDMDKAA